MCAPVPPNPADDALTAWSPAPVQDGSVFALSHGSPDKQKTRQCGLLTREAIFAG